MVCHWRIVSGGMLLLSTLVAITHRTVPFVTALLFAAEFGSSLPPALGAMMAHHAGQSEGAV
jgi:ABC-type transporter Mla maintaining outer membrane lipid asymmetry permease subunit MlaE